MRSPAAFLTLLLTVNGGYGCSGLGGPVPEQLEALAVVDETSTDKVQHQGQLTVAGGERDFQLTIGATATPVSVTVHSPGMSDLTEMSGRTITATLDASGEDAGRSILIADDQGAAYVGYIGYGLETEISALFGADLVTWGDTVATSRDASYDWTYTEAVFKTDADEVRALPGTAEELRLNGATWRVAVIAAYKVTPHRDAVLPCGGISDLLSYEMLRVKTAPQPAKLSRAPAATLAHLGCL